MQVSLTDTELVTIRLTVESSLERIRRHPFIAAARAGALSRAQAERWIMCAGRESRSFPAILEGMSARTTNERIRRILKSNLDDEFGNGNPNEAHFHHYLQLLDHIGLGRERFEIYEEKAGIRLALDLAAAISASPSEAVAIGYMLVNEGMTAITYGSVHTALRRYHPTMEGRFFEVHVEVDERHIVELYAAAAELSAESLDEVLFGIAIGERGMAVLLDEALGIFDLRQAA